MGDDRAYVAPCSTYVSSPFQSASYDAPPLPPSSSHVQARARLPPPTGSTCASVGDVVSPLSEPLSAAAAAARAAGGGGMGVMGGKRRRFRFKDAHDVAMLQAVVATRAHVAPHGLAQRLFDEATALLFERGALADVTDGPLPTGKTVWDRFRHLVQLHRGRGLGVSPVRSEVGQERLRLLEAIVGDMDGHRARREQQQQQLQQQHFLIRQSYQRQQQCAPSAALKREIHASSERAVRRKIASGAQSTCEELQSGGHTNADEQNVSSEYMHGASSQGEGVNEREEVCKREDVERLRLELELRRMDAEEKERRRRFEIEERFVKIEEDRTAVEVRRLQMEEDERKNARQERQLLTTLLTTLANGLLNK